MFYYCHDFIRIKWTDRNAILTKVMTELSPDWIVIRKLCHYLFWLDVNFKSWQKKWKLLCQIIYVSSYFDSDWVFCGMSHWLEWHQQNKSITNLKSLKNISLTIHLNLNKPKWFLFERHCQYEYLPSCNNITLFVSNFSYYFFKNDKLIISI